MSAGDRGNKHFMSQRHVSGECNAGFRKKKKEQERKQGTRSNMWLPRDRDGVTNLVFLERLPLATLENLPARTLVFPLDDVTVEERDNP